MSNVIELDQEEIARRGKEIYEREIKDKVLGCKGQLVSVDILSGDYEVGPDPISNMDKLRKRRPDAVIFGLRVGYQTAYTTGYMVTR